jgi:hypothetical protein
MLTVKVVNWKSSLLPPTTHAFTYICGKPYPHILLDNYNHDFKQQSLAPIARLYEYLAA